jgi:hypothetical protein
MAMAPAASAATQEDLAPTVSRVYPGADGRLVYAADEQGNTIQDFSHAGYGGGGAPIPTVPIRETVWPVPGDNTANVQAAIDKVSAVPLDKNGFRGAVLMKMGYYRMATPLRIQASGVVLRGEGMGDTGTILIGTGNPRAGAPPGPVGGQPTLVRIAGASGWTTKEETNRRSSTITWQSAHVASEWHPRATSGRATKRLCGASEIRNGSTLSE